MKLKKMIGDMEVVVDVFKNMKLYLIMAFILLTSCSNKILVKDFNITTEYEVIKFAYNSEYSGNIYGNYNKIPFIASGSIDGEYSKKHNISLYIKQPNGEIQFVSIPKNVVKFKLIEDIKPSINFIYSGKVEYINLEEKNPYLLNKIEQLFYDINNDYVTMNLHKNIVYVYSNNLSDLHDLKIQRCIKKHNIRLINYNLNKVVINIDPSEINEYLTFDIYNSDE